MALNDVILRQDAGDGVNDVRLWQNPTAINAQDIVFAYANADLSAKALLQAQAQGSSFEYASLSGKGPISAIDSCGGFVYGTLAAKLKLDAQDYGNSYTNAALGCKASLAGNSFGSAYDISSLVGKSSLSSIDSCGGYAYASLSVKAKLDARAQGSAFTIAYPGGKASMSAIAFATAYDLAPVAVATLAPAFGYSWTFGSLSLRALMSACAHGYASCQANVSAKVNLVGQSQGYSYETAVIMSNLAIGAVTYCNSHDVAFLNGRAEIQAFDFGNGFTKAKLDLVIIVPQYYQSFSSEITKEITDGSSISATIEAESLVGLMID